MTHIFDLPQVGKLYMKLGDRVAKAPDGARSLSRGERHALALLKSELENMLAHVCKWTDQSNPALKNRPLVVPSTDILMTFAADTPEWGAAIAEDCYGRD